MARLRWVNAVLALGFGAAAAVQVNDPDPVRWMALYGGAGVACLLHDRVRWDWMLAAAVGAVSIAWAAVIGVAIRGPVRFGDLFHPMEMKGGPVEETREALGLGIVGIWMAVLVAAAWRGRTRREGVHR